MDFTRIRKKGISHGPVRKGFPLDASERNIPWSHPKGVSLRRVRKGIDTAVVGGALVVADVFGAGVVGAGLIVVGVVG